ncbi:M20/M25/M40 family metallo-hydrolase [Chitinimonas arctica]|uniref:M20/M25/M40 family metallo-hydrolase n=2 Tax=Chitinimonas arctica TaxID=2594795 RepID=A0A516SMP6_9NEIS|nr:M20/M25/M40 family metallo-hydrolase [Chitinimonas arctica]
MPLARPWRKADVTTPAYTITQAEIVTELLPAMQASNIVATINGLTAFKNRYYTSQDGVAASDWLYRQWLSLANERRGDIAVEQIAHPGFPQMSVVLTIVGTDLADEIVVLGGHIDTVHDDADGDDDTTENTRAPGADDDASGIASLTEAARVIIDSGYKPRRTIKFMAYAAEEIELNGSRDIAKRLAKADIVGVLQLDMTNYKGSDRDIYMCSDYTGKAQNKFLVDLVRTYLRAPLYPQSLTTGWTRCGEEGSDHVSWHERGFAASMPFESAEGEKNVHIHSEHDTLGNSDPSGEHALKFGRLAAAFAVELGAGR